MLLKFPLLFASTTCYILKFNLNLYVLCIVTVLYEGRDMRYVSVLGKSHFIIHLIHKQKKTKQKKNDDIHFFLLLLFFLLSYFQRFSLQRSFEFEFPICTYCFNLLFINFKII